MPIAQERAARRVEFHEPHNLTEGVIWRARLIAEIEDITGQLAGAMRARKDDDGRKWTAGDYETWRAKALSALKAREATLRQLNAWLDGARKKQAVADKLPMSVAGVYELMESAYALLKRLSEEDVEYEDEEWDVVHALRAYLDSVEARVE